ncbi:MAG: carboxypeptidase regulatory-like domain-containing protein, partial [Acidobacteria bacterium]
MKTRYLCVAALLLMAVGAALFGQDPRGTMLGRVTDATGAVMPGVEVRATNAETGVTITALTNERGNFNMPFLLPAVYKVTAEMPGFKGYAREGVQIRVGQTVEINIPMEVGEISQTVNVTAETPVLDTAGASLGQIIDERRILELPLFAGNPAELTMLAPGVMNATDMRIRKAAFNNAPSQMATDGNGQYNNEFQIDGVSNNFANGNGTSRVAFSPPPTAIKEFNIQTNPYDASVGHTIGAVTNVLTASGANDIHGEAHYWARNSALDAPTFFQNKAGQKPAVYQDHRYGASAGGPVYIPHLYNGKNKTFWYYAYEGNKWGSPQSGYRTVPTEAMRRGDFSALLALGSTYQIYDPATTKPEGTKFRRQPFQGNIIPTNRLNPVSQKLAQMYPLPNLAGDKEFRSNYFYNLSANEDYYVHLIRLDHVFSENHRLFARIHYDWWEEDKDHWFGDYSAIILNRINRGFALDDVYV